MVYFSVVAHTKSNFFPKICRPKSYFCSLLQCSAFILNPVYLPFPFVYCCKSKSIGKSSHKKFLHFCQAKLPQLFITIIAILVCMFLNHEGILFQHFLIFVSTKQIVHVMNSVLKLYVPL